MRKFIVWGFLAALLAPVIHSCTTDFEVNAENLNIPIAYCVLNSADSFQYVRLQKTYLVDQAAMENPPHPDSMMFPGEIVIAIERWLNGKVVETALFHPVTDIPKDSGFFPTDKHILYRARMSVLPLQKYRLYIYIADKEKVMYAETNTIGRLTVVDPIDLSLRKISLTTGTNYVSRWEPVKNAGIYQVAVRFNYTETRNGETAFRHIDWPQGYTNPSSAIDYLSREISGARFMHILAENIEVTPDVVREVNSIDFIILSGGMELKYYIESTAPSEGALLEKPVYSNISNGIGLFSTISRVDIKGLLLSSVTIDSIAYSPLTRKLNFMDHTGDRDSTNRF
ncbi:MAG: hypothetical protein R6V75_08880 [Bacteroidales bacterium]